MGGGHEEARPPLGLHQAGAQLPAASRAVYPKRMDVDRRTVLGFGAALPLAACARRAARAALPADEWARVRADFDLEPGVINLDNGWTCTPPRAVYEVFVEHTRAINRLPARRLATMGADLLAPKIHPQLAHLLGVPAKELAMVRNTTEAIGTVLLGYPFAPGDEIVCCTQDYYAMLDMIATRRAQGVAVRRIDLPIPAPSPDAIADAYAKAITPKTRLVLVTHISNRTGQIMPVARIAELAHEAGAEVVVDAAQSFAILEHRVPDLGADYYCTSLHKWLASPVASGALWMKAEHFAKIPPRFGGPRPPEFPMAAYMDFGTVNIAEFVAAGAAIDYHLQIGAARKEARVRELVGHLRTGLAKISGIKFYTVGQPWASCAMLVFELPGKKPHDIQRALWERHKVLVQAQDPGDVRAIRGVRLSPAIYNTVDELDRAIDAIRAVA